MNSILEMGIESTLAILIPPNDPRALLVALTIIVVLFRKKNVRTIMLFAFTVLIKSVAKLHLSFQLNK